LPKVTCPCDLNVCQWVHLILCNSEMLVDIQSYISLL
jgi:hypothetical protein